MRTKESVTMYVYYLMLVSCHCATVLLRAVSASPLKVWMYTVYVLNHVSFCSFFNCTIFVRAMLYFLNFFTSFCRIFVMFAFAVISYMCPRALYTAPISFVEEGLGRLMLARHWFDIFLHFICVHCFISLNSFHTFFFAVTVCNIFLHIICVNSSF